MDYDSENSTVLHPYSTKQSVEYLRENYPLGYFGITFTLALPVGGFISNCVVFDLLHRIENPSTSFLWLKQMAIWNNVYLAYITISNVQFLLRLYVMHMLRVTCKTLSLVGTFIFYAAFAHFAPMFVDQALFLLKPTWHYKQDWKKVIPKCSLAIATFSFLYSLPYIAIVDIRNDSCEITHLSLNLANFASFCFAVCVLILSSNILFIVSLRRHRLKQEKEKLNKV